MDKNTEAKNIVYSLMGREGYYKIPRIVITHFESLAVAGLLSAFIYKMEHCQIKGWLREEKWFYYTREDIEKELFLSEYEQRKIIKILEESELVSTIIFPKSMPQRKYYTVNFDRLVQILSKENSII